MIASNGSISSLSPSLSALRSSDAPAFELKFLLEESHAQQVEAWARARMSPDPHGDPRHGGGYHTTTLYLDTPAMDVYHRTRSYARRKFRVRRYGMMTSLFLERKTKGGDRVTKRRVQVPEADLANLAHAEANAEGGWGGWPGHWFHRRIVLKGLLPACCISYDRTAYIGECPESPLRLTIDRNVRGSLCSDWRITGCDDGLPIIPGKAIVELKFIRALPMPFKELVREQQLIPSVVSKYRFCREVWGIPAAIASTSARAVGGGAAGA